MKPCGPRYRVCCPRSWFVAIATRNTVDAMATAARTRFVFMTLPSETESLYYRVRRRGSGRDRVSLIERLLPILLVLDVDILREFDGLGHKARRGCCLRRQGEHANKCERAHVR